MTIFAPLRVKEFREKDFFGYGVYGTPTDCVKLALSRLLPEKPDIVISGINAGPNVGPDILYSGTVAAATEAAHSGFPALALSMNNFKLKDARDQARHAALLVNRLDLRRLPSHRVVNINYPNLPIAAIKGMRVCPQTSAVWKDWYEERKDPRGNPYWWLEGAIPPESVEENSDKALLELGYITVTPLRFDFTDYERLPRLAELMPTDE